MDRQTDKGIAGIDERTYCQRCGEPFISPKNYQRILEIVETKGLDDFKSYFALCQNCRHPFFAEQMIKNNLEKVKRTVHVSERRKEKCDPVRKDTRLGTTVYKSQCFICNQGCDALVHVKDGVVVRVEGDTSSEGTKGTL